MVERKDEQLLVEYLSTRDVACPLCTYNLRGLTTPRCPECGRELKLSIGLTEPFMKAWVTLVAAICAATGVGLMLICLVLPFGWPPRINILGSAAMIYFFVSPVLLWPVLARRRAFLRMARGLQWVIAAMGCMAFVAALAVFVLTLK